MPDSDNQRPVRVVGIGGSTREKSDSLLALKAALKIAEEAGAQTVLADVRQMDLPLYNSDWTLASYPLSLPWLLEEVKKADALILCSPNYHGTISGAVKNVLDMLEFLGSETPPYFGGKVIGLMAVGGGGPNVLNSLHHAARALNGLAVPTVVGLAHSPIDTVTGLLNDESAHRRLTQMVTQLLDLAAKLRPTT